MTQRYCPHCGTRYEGDVRLCPQDGTSLFAVAVAEDRTGQVLAGKFRLERRLGSGGFGAVYEATNLTLGRRDAVKLLKPELSGNEEMVKRFFHEARMATRLRHPHTVTTYDLYQDDSGAMILAMELLEGETLGARLRREKRLDWPSAARIGSEVCESLEEAHAAGMVHRDLKPANIMLCRLFGRDDFVKVLDFGIAKAFEGRGDEPSLTGTGQLVGTPVYMSPEHIAGRPLDPRTDIYSLGVVLYEVVAGRLPFDNRETSAMVAEKLAGPARPLAEACAGLEIPAGFVQLVMAMLGLLPEQRPASVQVVRSALEALVRQGPVREADRPDGECETVNAGTFQPATAPFPPRTAGWAPGAQRPTSGTAHFGEAETETIEPPEHAVASMHGSQAAGFAADLGATLEKAKQADRRTMVDPRLKGRTAVEMAANAAVIAKRRNSAVPWVVAGGVLVVAAVLIVWQPWKLGGGKPGEVPQGELPGGPTKQVESIVAEPIRAQPTGVVRDAVAPEDPAGGDSLGARGEDGEGPRPAAVVSEKAVLPVATDEAIGGEKAVLVRDTSTDKPAGEEVGAGGTGLRPAGTGAEVAGSDSTAQVVPKQQSGKPEPAGTQSPAGQEHKEGPLSKPDSTNDPGAKETVAKETVAKETVA
ncbi:MAG: hypothetical protein FJ109_20215, partial [Deltaproteobacteria bacterium]|nr:hypothetical protein [Deltaproteobacteria bacterium]